MSEYHASNQAKDGKTPHCRECDSKKRKTEYYNNLEKKREAARLYKRKQWEKDPEAMKAARRKYLVENPHKSKEWGRRGHLKHKYGVTPEWYDQRFDIQGGACLVCNRKDIELVIDHNHETNEVRGLLCNPCNMLVGFVEKDVTMIKRLVNHIKGGLEYEF